MCCAVAFDFVKSLPLTQCCTCIGTIVGVPISSKSCVWVRDTKGFIERQSETKNYRDKSVSGGLSETINWFSFSYFLLLFVAFFCCFFRWFKVNSTNEKKAKSNPFFFGVISAFEYPNRRHRRFFFIQIFQCLIEVILFSGVQSWIDFN